METIFNLKTELKVLTCDKYNFVNEVLKDGVKNGIDDYGRDVSSYFLPSTLKIVTQVEKGWGNETVKTDRLIITPSKLSHSDFGKLLNMFGRNNGHTQHIDNLAFWMKQYPETTWQQLRHSGIDVQYGIPAKEVQVLFDKYNPEKYMAALCLLPNSQMAGLIGREHGRRGYGMSKDERATCLLRLWVLYGLEVPLSAGKAAHDKILDGLNMHNFGITHCETMETFIESIKAFKYVTCAGDEEKTLMENVSNMIRAVDKFLKDHGGTAIVRRKPRSPFLRQIFENVTK